MRSMIRASALIFAAQQIPGARRGDATQDAPVKYEAKAACAGSAPKRRG